MQRAVEVGIGDLQLLDDAVGERRQVDELAAQHEPARLQPGDVEQLGDEAGDAVGVVVDLLEHHLLLLVADALPAVQQQRRVALDRRERAAQLVAHRRHDLGAGRLAVAAPLAAGCATTAPASAPAPSRS